MKKASGALVLSLFISLCAGSVAQADTRANTQANTKTTAKAASRKPSSVDDVPLFRHVHDCNVDLNPILSYVGLGTMTTAKFGGEAHTANIVPAPPLTPHGRAGFYILSDRNQAVFIDIPVQADEAMEWSESGPFSKRAAAVTKDRNVYEEDAINGRFEAEVNLTCTADFAFRNADGTPLRKLVDSETGAVYVGGVAIPGTCHNFPSSPDFREIPRDRKLEAGKIDRNVAGPEVDKAAIDDLHVRLSEAMNRVIQNIRNAAKLADSHPEVKWDRGIGLKGADARKNACHLVSTFFKAYNECASQSLSGAGGLGEISQNDTEFHQRLAELGTLYASFREPSDSAECKPPVGGPAADHGGQTTSAAP